jgi:hypothetical protein
MVNAFKVDSLINIVSVRVSSERWRAYLAVASVELVKDTSTCPAPGSSLQITNHTNFTFRSARCKTRSWVLKNLWAIAGRLLHFQKCVKSAVNYPRMFCKKRIFVGVN